MVSRKNTMVRWAGLLLIRNKKVLMVRESGKEFFMLPGGRVNKGEKIEEALRRELREELGVSLIKVRRFKERNLPGKAEGEIMNFTVFKGEVLGSPTPSSDIEEVKWVNSRYKEESLDIGVITSIWLFPELKRSGLII
jgi:8-oxo-dGTP diphosphatase